MFALFGLHSFLHLARYALAAHLRFSLCVLAQALLDLGGGGLFWRLFFSALNRGLKPQQPLLYVGVLCVRCLR
jgi:hypothetical protein